MKPLSNKIVVLPDAVSNELKSGIKLPSKNTKFANQTGVVVKVGPGLRLANGDRLKPDVTEGERVLFSSQVGAEVEMDGTVYIILTEEQIDLVL